MPQLANRYNDGIWYDAYNGDFCRIRDVGDGIAFCNPETGEEYYRMTYLEFDEEKPWLNQVSDHAIENPDEVVDEFIRTSADLSSLSESDEADVQFALANTKVVETDDASYIAEYI
jgi:hypothetical protein